jgi:transposase InsO family protein
MLESHYPVSLVCEVLALSRSSYYYLAASSDDDRLRLAIADLAAAWPTYGSRRLTAQLRREPHHLEVNRKRVQRVMREMGLVSRRKRACQATTDSRHSYPRYPNLVAGLEVSEPDEVWVSDITYVRLRSEFIYLAVIMDVFTRIIRGWRLSRSLAVELTLAALEQALAKAVPRIHHSDQGVQYAATEYTRRLVEAGVLISMAEVGHAEQNGYCERVIRTIKEEEVYLSEYRDFDEAREQIGRFIDDVYLSKRIHSSLGYLTPAEFEQRWRQEQSQAIAFTLSMG